MWGKVQSEDKDSALDKLPFSNMLKTKLLTKLLNSDDIANINKEKDQYEQKQREKRENMKNLKIHEKGTISIEVLKNTKNLNRIHSRIEKARIIDIPSLNKQLEIDRINISKKDDEVIKQAIAKLIERQEIKLLHEDKARESIYQRMTRTTEVHILKRTSFIIKEEIKGLHSKGLLKKEMIQSNEQDLRDDFTKFIQIFTSKKQELNKQQEKLVLLKTSKNELLNELKEKNSELESIKAENKKLKENIMDMKQLQEFIDKLTPESFYINRTAEAFFK